MSGVGLGIRGVDLGPTMRSEQGIQGTFDHRGVRRPGGEAAGASDEV
jgi:hypothetical protein